MKIRRLTWRAYRIPFRSTFVTSAGAQSVREGLLVCLEGEGGLDGLGEIAPLRSSGMEEAARRLRLLARRLPGADVDDIPRAVRLSGVSREVGTAIQCGLDIAACDVLAKEAGVPVVELLGGCRRRTVPVNATISADTPQQAAQAASRAVENGFRCLKLKVGMMSGVAGECELVSAVRDAIGADILLRLDANQAWDVEQAIANINALQRFGVQFVEQPVAARDLAGLAAVRSAVSTPIAADERVTGVGPAKEIIEHRAADLLVVKPMVVGGLRLARDIIDLAAQAGLDSVVTTTIDSGVGIAAALHLAASFEGKLACGLATADLLESSLTCGIPAANSGVMACPDGPGLGVEIDEVEAASYLERT
ncbi:MAG TPA: o-succinylbenzoate synthase [Candidatus Binataceae bacterium]|nr:o-succinylbenzoate synthase [Candidatus Binataceae bacterium]